MISRSIWMKALLCPLVLSTPCPRRNLRLCISSSTRTWPLGISIPHAHPMGPWFSLSIKKTVHYGFALILEDSIRFPKKDRYSLPLISDLLDAPRKARVYTKIDLRHAYHLV